jgi:DNA mismatch repair ATPase MutS
VCSALNDAGIEKLQLKKSRHLFVMTISDKLDYAKIDKLRQFASIVENRTTKSYVYNQWSQLGGKTEKHMEDMLFAQRRAFDLLRDKASHTFRSCDTTADDTQIVSRSIDIQHNAELMDELDLSLSFAQTAADLGYVRPVLNDSYVYRSIYIYKCTSNSPLTPRTDLEIVDGRHPTVESSLLNSSRAFTPNSTSMSPSSYVHIITGPNQGGKSTLLRQTAVIAILAQAGSFVPAREARMGVVDRVFSRIGARDDLFRDRSTFMLEMVE